jgi:hypothetical protein
MTKEGNKIPALERDAKVGDAIGRLLSNNYGARQRRYGVVDHNRFALP